MTSGKTPPARQPSAQAQTNATGPSEPATTITLESLSRALATEQAQRLKAEDERDQAQASNRAKAAFVSAMSHEVRTPLNGVIGMIELLRGTRTDREQQAYLDTLNQSAEALLTIVNDLLDFSNIEAGRMQIESRGFSPLRLVQDTIALIRPQAEEKGLNLLLWAGALPERVVGDPTHLQQVWMNLLSNAVKFTERGEVRLDLKADRQGSGRCRLHGMVTDTGAGIDRERQRRMMETLAAPQILATPDPSGAGLGLSIASKLLKLMGGELSLESEPGVGSRIGFSVMTEEVSREENSPKVSGFRTVPMDQLKVLIAEDNPVNQTLALAVLGKFGIQAELARDGEEALQAVRRQPFDVVLMDVQMPRLDGLAATRAIRALPRNQAQPWIIAVTANAFDQDRQRCLDAGMDDFISKPFRQEALHDALLHARPRPAQSD